VTTTELNPLFWNVPIVDKAGLPTPDFMRKWQQQQTINKTIIDLSNAAAVSAVLDLISATVGQILIRGASSWSGQTMSGDGTLSSAGALTVTKSNGTPFGTAAFLASDTDGTLAANSDTRIATQKAVKTYVDAHTGGAPGGSSGQIQYNNAGAFDGFTVSGDATLNTGTGALTIANDAVTYAKMQNISAASKLLGRGSASGSGDTEEITLGSGLSMSGTTLTAVPSSGGAGAGYHPGFQSGRYYGYPGFVNGANTAMVANRLYVTPFYVPFATTFTKISVSISAGAAGKSIELGVYANSSGIPGALEYDCGTISAAATGIIELTGLSISLSAGWHFLACASDGTPSIRMTNSTSSSVPWYGWDGSNIAAAGANVYVGWTFSAGALPNPFGSVTYDSLSNIPLVFLRL
jgi:hypothetical protein